MTIQKSKPVIVFDVNETLLDMTPLKKSVNALLNEEQGFRIWFGMLLHYSTVSNSINEYHNFTTIAAATLDMAATSLHKKVTSEEIKETLSVIKSLQTYPDVIKGLQLLKENGFRLITLTNSPDSALKEQLKNSNLTDYFEQALSIDTIEKYKPAAETYLWAANKLNVKPEEMLMIAAHGWDLAGASHAGLATGFIAREGQSQYSLSSKPNFETSDILAMAEQLVAAYKQ
ncbi:haloacid dehalogenase type II [Flavobacterium degerlachei]|jgi:2-haloacid dehalogenase|uniref:2-haloacid dehalogenase n=1 Tax=Flavobacterium degerlachei TaxID=229203 RepID=A0A1H2ZFW3_9FLAO|nr:haloacid dehalogenase type II [Flavobacterium degerlachei]SDX16245.1 2-haloacid dehalogenase [Flavobacterium degerlachei]